MQVTDPLKNILIQNRQYTDDYSITTNFIDWVIQSKEIFKRIIPQLPTRKIAGSETLLNKTLFYKIVLARFLIKHMIKHGELEVSEKARISSLLRGVENKPSLNEEQRKAVLKINRMLGQGLFNSNGFNFTAFYDACFFERVEQRFPLECLFAGIMKQSVRLISSAFESKTKEELDIILNHRNLILPIQIPVHPLSQEVTINPHDNVLDFASKLPSSEEKLYPLIQVMRSTGLGDLVDDWLNKHPEDKLLVDIQVFMQTVVKIKKEEGDALPELNSKLHAKHKKSTKKDRLILKRIFTECVQLAFTKDSIPVPAFRKGVTFHLENRSYEAYFAYDTSHHPSCLQHNGKTVALNYPISEIFTMRHFYALFQGHELEVSFYYKSDEWLAKDFWDNWERKNHSQIYTTTIYPTFTLAIDRIRPMFKETPLFLDVCGGKGLIARSILNRHRVSYLLLEYNELSVREARQRLGDEAVVVNTDVVNDSEWFSDPDKKAPLQGQVVDVAIASGALAHTVLKSKDEALAVLKKIHNYLKSGGYLLLSGQTDSYINAEDFRANGFTVHNATLPTHQHFFYIVQKR